MQSSDPTNRYAYVATPNGYWTFDAWTESYLLGPDGEPRVTPLADVPPTRDPLAAGNPLSRYSALYGSTAGPILTDSGQRGPVPHTDSDGCPVCDALTEVGGETPCRECRVARKLDTPQLGGRAATDALRRILRSS